MALLNISRRGLRLAAVVAAVAALGACVTPPPRTVLVQPPPPPPPQKIFVYPANGQSPEQTDRDRYECHMWAVQQTGVDPSRPDASPYERVVVQSSVPPGAGTATGAIAGGILGAIIGGPRNAGAGLVLGAATGAIVGTAAEANANAQAQRQANMTQAQINAQVAEGRAHVDAYRRALGACLQGRGYTVT
ncbi:MAG: glycine zipper family protein [Steroidobacteraceae bacterium]